MKPGDPFETEKTDETRSRQRRLLRFLDDWTVRKAMANRQPLDLSEEWAAAIDGPMVELSVRDLVDEQLAQSAELQAMVEALGRANTIGQLSGVLQNQLSGIQNRSQSERDLRRVLGKLADSVGQKAWEERAKAETDGTEEVQALLLRFISLLLLADELASDGYKDPRRVD